MVDGSMSRSLSSRALQLALVFSSAVLLGGLALSGTQALATGGEVPSIQGVSATDITAHGGGSRSPYRRSWRRVRLPLRTVADAPYVILAEALFAQPDPTSSALCLS